MDRDISKLSAAERRALLKDLLRKKGAEAPASPALRPDPEARHQPFPATPIQQAYLLGRRPGFAVSGVACHTWSEVELEDVVPERLFDAWEEVLRRHDMLRAVVEGEQVRVLPELPAWRPTVVDLRGQNPEPTIAAGRQRLSVALRDPAAWPAFELQLYRLDERRWTLLFSLDLMCVDASGVLLLVDEWTRIHQGEALPPAPSLSFRDYRLAALPLEEGPAAQRARRYWEDRIDGLAGPPELPAPPEGSADTVPTRRSLLLSPERWSAFRAHAHSRGLTPNSALAMVFSAALSAYGSHDDHCLTVTLFDRQPLHPEVSELVGEFTSTLLLEVRGRQGSFAERARRLGDQLAQDLQHSAWSGLRVLRELNRRRGGMTTFPIVFTSTLGARPGQRLGRVVRGGSQTPQVWLDHQIFEEGGGLRVNWDTVDSQVASGLMEAMFDSWAALLHRLCEQDERWDQPVRGLIPASQLALREKLNRWEGEPPHQSLVAAFLEQARRHPEAPAAQGPEQRYSYGQLEARSAHLAARLVDQGASGLVAVLLPRSPLQAIATLGVLRAGCAYLPIDPELPLARIQVLLEDGQVQQLISEGATEERLRGALPAQLRWLPALDEGPAPEALLPQLDPSSLAYVIYTSGSTGKPKGVMVSHEAAWNTIEDINQRCGVGPGDAVLALSALSFDLSVWDLFGLLGAGACLIYPPPDGARDPMSWPLQGITLWNTVPQLMEMLLDSGRALPSSLRAVLWSGDWIPLSLPARLRAQLPQARLISLGGATEASIWSILHEIDELRPEWSSVPYGTPLRHQRWHILDADLEPRPDGVPGELYIGGFGLALGYWADPERSRERFFLHPRTGERLYRTGDLGRAFPDGSIEFLGRKDHQVKIRGHRVELGKVEATLLAHPGVAAAVAGAVDRRRLVAWVVSRGQLVPPSALAGSWEPGLEQARALQLPPPPAALEEAQRSLGERALHWIGAALARMGHLSQGQSQAEEELLAGLSPAHQRWMRRSLHLLARRGDLGQEQGRWVARRPLNPAVPPSVGGPSELVAQMDRIGAAIPDVLAGRITMLELSHAGGQAEQATRIYDAAFAEVYALLGPWLAGLPVGLRVVEVGGGGGGTTAVALRHLRAPQYLFTDISRLFLEDAARRWPGLPVARLDLDADPDPRRLSPAGRDLILSGGALHVARDLRASLCRLRDLLAPGGVLAIVESTRFLPMMQVLTALQPGFDAAEDLELRPQHCLLSAEAWEALLREVGFAQIERLEGPSSPLTGALILLARRAPEEQVLLCPSEEDLRAHVAARLPEHMVPAAIVELEALPLSANGKVDRAALPLPAAEEEPWYEQTQSPLEQQVAQIWAAVLGLERVRAADRFFGLGGDSLSAVRVAARLGELRGRELPLRWMLANPSLADLARLMEEQSPELTELGALHHAPALRPDPEHRHTPFPLTDVQQAYWMGRDPSLALGGVATWFYMEFEPELRDPQAWERSWQGLIGAHEALRTSFLPDGTQQVMAQVPAWRMELLDLRGGPKAEGPLQCLRREMEAQLRPAEQWPLFDIRASLRDGPEGPVLRLHFGLDLLVADGWGMMTLLRQWGELAQGAPLPPAPALSFRDCVLAMASEEGSPRWHEDRQWWMQRLEGLPPAPALPLVQEATAARPRFRRWETSLSRAAWQGFKRQAARQGLTPASALLASFARVLATFSQSPDLTINLTLFNRPPMHPEVEAVVGDFTSTLLLETHSPGGEGLAAAAARLQAQLQADLEHRSFGGLRVARELSIQRGETALFPVVFTSGLSMATGEGLRGGRYVYGLSQTPQVWLDHQVGETADGLLLSWDAAEDRFLPGVLDDMFRLYGELLEGLCQGPTAWAASPEELPRWQAERRQALNRWDGHPPRRSLQAGFLEQARLRPQAPALIAGELQWSYAALEERSRALALALRGARGLVAVVLPRGPDQVVAVLAILRAGLAYLPIDPELPPARIQALLDDGEVQLAISRAEVAAGICLERVPRWLDVAHSAGEGVLPEVPPEALAYVIYTSGSTGQPKGVMISHEAAWNTIEDIHQRCGVGPEDRCLALSSLSFDLSVYDIFGLLHAGGAIVWPAEARDPQTWGPALERGVTLWNSVPQLLELYLEARGVLPESLRLVLLSGDWIPIHLPGRVRQQCPEVRIFSLGGATEGSIWSIAHEIRRVDPRWSSIPYGLPLRFQPWRVIGPEGRQLPDQVTGELCIGGAGLALGYWRDPERTAQRFITDPQTGQRWYRTGDLGRYRPDGSLELLGRMDTQVKLSGHRVELGEVEAALCRQPGVQSALALALGERQERRLVAAVTGTAETEALRQALGRSLPAYMVPGRILRLEALPLSSNGKLDRRALEQAFRASAQAEVPAAPASPGGAAERVLQIAREVLELPDLPPDANLLRHGASSIDLLRLGNRLHAELGLQIPAARLLLEPTIERLLAELGEALPAAPPAPTAPSRWEIIGDPASRRSFKEGHPERRRDLEGQPVVAFDAVWSPEQSSALARRRSRRHYGLEPIPQHNLGQLLSVLRRGPPRDDGQPTSRYASVGGMWAVSAALHIKAGRVEGLEPGTWRYDPEGHRLQLIQAGVSLPARLQLTSENRSIAEESAFAFFLVVEMAALGPLYGEDGERLALLEAGAMTQLLEQQAHELGLDTCQIGGMAPEELRAALRLSETQRVLHVILGGPRDPTPTPAAERQARLVERIRRLRPDQVRGLLAARKRAQEEE